MITAPGRPPRGYLLCLHAFCSASPRVSVAPCSSSPLTTSLSCCLLLASATRLLTTWRACYLPVCYPPVASSWFSSGSGILLCRTAARPLCLPAPVVPFMVALQHLCCVPASCLFPCPGARIHHPLVIAARPYLAVPAESSICRACLPALGDYCLLASGRSRRLSCRFPCLLSVAVPAALLRLGCRLLRLRLHCLLASSTVPWCRVFMVARTRVPVQVLASLRSGTCFTSCRLPACSLVAPLLSAGASSWLPAYCLPCLLPRCPLLLVCLSTACSSCRACCRLVSFCRFFAARVPGRLLAFWHFLP